MRMLPLVWVALAACESEETPAELDCDTPGQICTIAGSGNMGFGGDGGAATDALLYAPTDAVWLSGEDFVVIDWNNHKLRLVEDGQIQTVVGRIHPLEGDGAAPPEGIDGPELGINHPVQADVGPDGEIYVAGWHNHRVFRWSPEDGRVRPVAGTVGGYEGDGAPAHDAKLQFPTSLAFGPDGSMLVVDQGNSVVRRIAEDGMIDTVAGTGEAGESEGALFETAFRFFTHPGMQNIPAGALEVGADGIAWVTDTFNGRLVRVDLDGDTATTVLTGLADPRDVEEGPDGRIYVLDTEHFVVLAVDPVTFESEVVAGTGVAGAGDDGVPALDSDLSRSHGIEFAEDGALVIADTFNHRIRRVAPTW
jgi:sugar lactone lactonase YvrE